MIGTVTLDSIAMRWEERGEGPPLVLIHGIPTSPALWRHVMPRIVGARCLAFEMVGYGASIPQGRDIRHLGKPFRQKEPLLHPLVSSERAALAAVVDADRTERRARKWRKADSLR